MTFKCPFEKDDYLDCEVCLHYVWFDGEGVEGYICELDTEHIEQLERRRRP